MELRIRHRLAIGQEEQRPPNAAYTSPACLTIR